MAKGGNAAVKKKEVAAHEVSEEDLSMHCIVMIYLSYMTLMAFGHLRDAWRKVTRSGPVGMHKPGFAPLLSDYEDFYTRRLYTRIRDCWDRPIRSNPGDFVDVVIRESDDYNKTLKTTEKTKRCFNLGSYNYLGFGDPTSPTQPSVFEALEQYGVSTCSPRTALGSTQLHHDLEALVARYVGKEDAIVFGMGFGTNALGLSSLVGKGGLLVSDAQNHSSIVVGARASGSKVKVFKHNDAKDLEKVLRRAIVDGQPRTRRPWTKIMVVVEGIYSMEGEMCPLADIVAVCKKYKAFLYVDEAHSIGAIGKTGRGICEYANVDPGDIDVLMGTFTKSFGAVGGYIAADKATITYLRQASSGSQHSASLAPAVCQQVISAIKIILGEDGTTLGQEKLTALKDNIKFFREGISRIGCHVMGVDDSPVVPMMIYYPAKIPAFSRECLDRDLAVVVVGFPATSLIGARSRFCISAAHKRKDLADAIEKIGEVVRVVGMGYGEKYSEADIAAKRAQALKDL